VLDSYLHHWKDGQSMEDCYRMVWSSLHPSYRMVAWLNRRVPLFRRVVERATRLQLQRLALKKDGTMCWIRENNLPMIGAFYGSVEEFRAIPGWDGPMPNLDHRQEFRRLGHGYDESKAVPDLEDLRNAATFRGGSLVSETWDGNLSARLHWRCREGHLFELSPDSVLKGGHWCMECLSPPRAFGAV